MPVNAVIPPIGCSLVGGVGAAIGKTIRYEDVYTTDERLRSGSYGTVYTCHHRGDPLPVAAVAAVENGAAVVSSTTAESTGSTTPYAVKIIDRKKLKKKDDEGVFREVKILEEMIGVPNIIQLKDFFAEPERLYVVQNLAAGGDVFDRLASRKTYSEKDARALARVLLKAMDAMHQIPVVHRDLKPENLLLANGQDDSSILLADFGFARHVKPEGCTTRCGTPAFVAPEVVIGVPYGCAVDMWSIGCLLYMLIGGYPPFSGKNHRELFRKIRAADFVFHDAFFGKVSESAKTVISHLLTVNKDLRWSARQCLESDWFKKETAASLSNRDLSGAVQELKRFKARRSWKAARVVLKWASTQPFWKPDAVSFANQMTEWDKEAIATPSPDSSVSNVAGAGGSVSTLASVMSTIPQLRFADVYELKEKLRKGSYAVIWKAEHKQTGEVFAVKVVQRQGLKPSDDEAVMNEVAIMQQLLGKKHFIQLLDFYEESDAFYLVMEYMTGGDVFDQVIKQTHYTEKDARDLIVILLKAVLTLHELGIAHRDIKPQNLMLYAGDSQDIKIGDFGFARRVHTRCSLTSRMGTPTYVAPEILKNIPHDDRVDLWSIGVVTFVLLVGYPPFLEDNQSALFEKIRTGEWEFIENDWRHVSKDAKDFVRGLLVVDPKERWSIKECLRCAWIKKDPNNLSSIDLSISLNTLRARRSRLRGLAKTVMWLGRDLHTVQEVRTAAQVINGSVSSTEEEKSKSELV